MEDEILGEFLAESWENLSRLDNEIVELERHPGDQNLLGSIFRTIHTIKGTCGFIGLTGLGSTAHAAENVLGQLRDGKLLVTPTAISLVLEAIDRIKEYLHGIEANGKEIPQDNTRLIANLNELADGKLTTLPTAAQPAATPAAEPPAATTTAAQSTAAQSTAVPAVETVVANVQSPAVGAPAAGTPSAVPQAVIANEHRPATPAPPPKAPVAQNTFTASAVQLEHDIDQESTRQNNDGDKKSIADLSIRVGIDVVDRLMNLVGELVLTRNQLLQMVRGEDESKYSGPITQLNRVTTDLQEGVMKTRMQPIGNAWSKMPRLVRDLANTTGKMIELEMTGAETELDRTVLDAIKDPLTHMVRNSADHGLESPEKRRLNGKSETGRIKLQAYHEGGHVIICIEDDGAGIPVEKVRAKAIAAGLVSERDAARLSDKEIINFVFLPGLSTADKITSVSGRGVGMDVVKTQIERIGGTVELNSQFGRGTIVRIKIPLTLAIISALVVGSGDLSFAIPQLGVVELVRLPAEESHRIERIHRNEVFRLRNRLLPLVHLDRILKLNHPDQDNAGPVDVNIVVVQVGDEQFGLIVDEVFDTEEIVVKPVGTMLKSVSLYQGTTILGDGRVIMILDVAGVATMSGGVSTLPSEREANKVDDESASDHVTSLLVVDSGSGASMAVPLSLVARLEEIPKVNIERSGERLLVQYRGNLLPLLPIHGHSGDDLVDPQPVVVFSEGNHSMGLMVNQIQDILQEQLIIRMHSQRPGILGTAIVNGRATDIIDTHHYVTQANPDWFKKKQDKRLPRVIVVDDSIFFRQLVTTALESEGYRVRTLDSAAAVLALLESNREFELIVSDIEMPGMDGFELAATIRKRGWTEIPMMALTSLNCTHHEVKAKQVGFDRFQVKYNAKQFLATVAELCSKATQPAGISA